MVSAQRLKDALSLVERKAGLIVDGLYRLDAVLQLRAAWGDGAVHGEGKACCDARARAEVQEIMRTAKDLLACRQLARHCDSDSRRQSTQVQQQTGRAEIPQPFLVHCGGNV
jgi:hypothetical protein